MLNEIEGGLIYFFPGSPSKRVKHQYKNVTQIDFRTTPLEPPEKRKSTWEPPKHHKHKKIKWSEINPKVYFENSSSDDDYVFAKSFERNFYTKRKKKKLKEKGKIQITDFFSPIVVNPTTGTNLSKDTQRISNNNNESDSETDKQKSETDS